MIRYHSKMKWKLDLILSNQHLIDADDISEQNVQDDNNVIDAGYTYYYCIEETCCSFHMQLEIDAGLAVDLSLNCC